MNRSPSPSPEEQLINYRLMVAAANAAADEAKTPEERNAFIAKASEWKSLIEESVRALEGADPDATLPLHPRRPS